VPLRLPLLSVAQTLACADAHHARSGAWPHADRGHVLDNRNEKWVILTQTLLLGLRGLPAGDSLARFLDGEGGASATCKTCPAYISHPPISGFARRNKRLHSPS
jgi:hypothetical protein